MENRHNAAKHVVATQLQVASCYETDRSNKILV